MLQTFSAMRTTTENASLNSKRETSSAVMLAFCRAMGRATVGASGKSMGSTPASAHALGICQLESKRNSPTLTHNLGKGLQAEFLSLGGRHEDESRRAVAEGGRVGSGDETSSLEGRAKAGNLVGDDLLVLLVLADDGFALLALDCDRNYLSIEGTRAPSTGSAGVRFESMSVDLFAGDAMLLCRVFAAVTHREVVVDVPEAIVLEGILGRELAKGWVLAREQESNRPISKHDRWETSRHSRCVAHALHASGSDDGAFTKFNGLCGQHNGLHAAGADLVDRGGIGAGLEAGREGNLTSG